MRELNRHQSREVAVQFLYQIDINQDSLVKNMENLHQEHPDLDLSGNFLTDIIEGTYQKRDEIDELIDENIVDWKMNRIGKVDKNIIRLAMYEILYQDDIPVAVSINEAIELAKSFSDQKSANFVHGVLARIVEKLDLGHLEDEE